MVLAGRRRISVADPVLRQGDARSRQRRCDHVPGRVLDWGRVRIGAVRPANARRGQRALRATGSAGHGAFLARPGAREPRRCAELLR